MKISPRSTPTSTTARRLLATAAVLLLATPLAACGEEETPEDGTGGSGSATTEINVLAAASLTDVFGALKTTYESEHPGITVNLSLGSSTDLAEQAADGAPGDVLATADQTAMDVAEGADVTENVETFATNVLVIVTPPGNPAGIEGLDDLEGSTWVRCADEAPCGRVALGVLDDNGITAEPASLEEDVRATLEKVEDGEADAGLVYASDAVAAGDAVDTVEIPGAEEELTSYFVARLSQSVDADLAQEWVDLVTSEEGQQALTEAGFTLP